MTHRFAGRPVYIVGIAGILATLMVAMVVYEFRRSRGDLIRVMEEEAALLIQALDLAGENAVYAFDEIEALTADRLLDNARSLDRLDRSGMLSPRTIAQIAEENGLHRVDVLEPDGLRAFGFCADAPDSDLRPFPRDLIEPILNGEEREHIVGFQEDRSDEEEHFAVAIRRSRGGAIVLGVDAVDMLAFRREVGVGRLVQDIADRRGIEYIVVQDERGLILASQGVRRMTKIAHDPFLRGTLEREGISSRMTRYEDREVFEVVQPFVLDEVPYGLLRIGLSTDHLAEIAGRARTHMALMAVVLVAVGFLVLGFLIVQQNYALLDREHDRILGEVRRMEEDLRRTERLSAMGKLAAGVAHEIRNPLNAIGMLVQRLEKEFEPSEDEEEYRGMIRTVRSEVQRVNKIVHQFLTFARPPKLHLMPTAPDAIVREVLATVAAEVDAKEVELLPSLDAGRPIPLDGEQMKQVLLNLVFNALDAVSSGGHVEIHTKQDEAKSVIEVRDTGVGILMENLDRIFDPYFTTKDKGTGLGLAIAHRIVTEHGGRIEVESGEGVGTTFRVELMG